MKINMYEKIASQMDPRDMTDMLFELTIQKAKKVYINEKVRGVTTKNENGILSVVAMYADCIAFIEEIIIVNRENGEKKEIPIHNGILRVEKGKVFVFLDALTQ